MKTYSVFNEEITKDLSSLFNGQRYIPPMKIGGKSTNSMGITPEEKSGCFSDIRLTTLEGKKVCIKKCHYALDKSNKYIEWALKNQHNSLVPKIYFYKKTRDYYVVVMERLRHVTSTTRTRDYTFNTASFNELYNRLCSSNFTGPVARNFFNKEETKKNVKEFHKFLNSLSKADFKIDMHDGNYMVRTTSDGKKEIVITDPIHGFKPYF